MVPRPATVPRFQHPAVLEKIESIMSEAPAVSRAVTSIVRIAVLADSRLTEIALPVELPLREILPAVQRLVAPAGAADAEPAAGPTGPLSLAPLGGAPR